MASHNAHHASGFAAGVAAAALVAQTGATGPWHTALVAAFIAGVAGGTAPDWLELAWWSRKRRLWIAHRTVTHWGIGWLALLALGWHGLTHHPHPLWAAPLFGFACGGLMHLLADWPNPLGVPWIWRRHSLNLWNSGHCDLIVVAAAWGGTLWLVQSAWARAPLLQHWLGWLHRV
ncbi:metal-dependent hydrolase [Burkholderia multivorans]|uniref:Metal-dependent hydrolase n=1 Tax=Burkholderia multivorans TaxID=87883 RepID=A0A2S9MLB5_9BURK|nr:metal-dependent hydrolase [Burkholderia multivorans]MBU9145486.1 metal-dependent hydrolase [Burkholderia multivorans]MBU9513678.1 metal-dependent hydrolase [Burkholderia multivorans]MBU9524690.1 metal-dependent hydrolase [Burkholderia multivorans]MBU9537446.1 metal-dependent hydrolase [Burkholderia multivorans]MBU9637433.1 metal-dependent hydrolase [Burkholderia multivorans]